jgi:hypothetical protein
MIPDVRPPREVVELETVWNGSIYREQVKAEQLPPPPLSTGPQMVGKRLSLPGNRAKQGPSNRSRVMAAFRRDEQFTVADVVTRVGLPANQALNVVQCLCSTGHVIRADEYRRNPQRYRVR